MTHGSSDCASLKRQAEHSWSITIAAVVCGGWRATRAMRFPLNCSRKSRGGFARTWLNPTCKTIFSGPLYTWPRCYDPRHCYTMLSRHQPRLGVCTATFSAIYDTHTFYLIYSSKSADDPLHVLYIVVVSVPANPKELQIPRAIKTLISHHRQQVCPYESCNPSDSPSQSQYDDNPSKDPSTAP